MNRKIFAVMSVMIMLMAGLIVVTANGSDDTVATDPTPSDYAPTAFATDAATETFKVLAYKDEVLLIDTRAMTTLGDETNFYIGLTPDSVTVDHATEIMIGPLSLQNGRIFIDAAAGLTDSENTCVALYKYDEVYNATPTALAFAPLAFVDDDAKLVLKTNHSTGWAKVNFPTEGEYVTFDDQILARNEAAVMDKTLDTVFDGETDGYYLKGWAFTSAADSPIVIKPTASIKIEDIIFDMADAIRQQGTHVNPIVHVADPASNTITLYAIWEEIVYTLEVANTGTESSAVAGADPTGWGTKDVEIQISSVTKAKASITSQVTKNSFAILRIAQTEAGQYVYDTGKAAAVVYKCTAKDPNTGAKTWAAATLGTDYDIKMITNGVYRVTTSYDLRICILMSVTTKPETTAYAFQIDQIRNDDGAVSPSLTPGYVNLSLDLYDYRSKYAYTDATHYTYEQIAIEGTYFRDADDGQRIYGDLKNLTGTTETPYIDNVALTGEDKTAHLKNYQYTSTRETADPQAMQLIIADQREDTTVFDLSYDLEADTYIYAAKGVWNQLNNAGEGLTVTNIDETPWVLYRASSATL